MRRGWGFGKGRQLRFALGCGVLALFLISAAPAAAAEPSFAARGSVKQVYVTDLAPGASATLLNSGGQTVATKQANSLGGLLFRNVTPGYYRVTSGSETSRSFVVFTEDSTPLSHTIYNQSIPSSGYGYLRTRDGTRLAIYVHPASDVTNATPGVDVPPLPNPPVPTPTLIEYSGYGYADPAGPQSGISIIANLMGFTVVDVNMRGTGCSGGAYDFFEPLQNLDGYDVIETIANQPWVKGHKVGMMGISYGGISQLFTAQTQPPDLAAIAPFSVLDSAQTTLYPGGILNTGFALNWAEERVHDALPAGPNSGQNWAYQRIQNGDTTCEANQALHPEAVDLIAKIRANDHYVPEVADPLSPITFVNKINVPTFMACQWTDEQTGGHCPDLAEHMTGTNRKWFTFTNGTHVDSLAPATFNRWCDFLSIYVADDSPATHCAQTATAAPVIYQVAMGITGVTMPPDPIQALPYAAAKTAFEQLAPIRILFDNGAGGPQPAYPNPGFEQSFSSFPIPGTTVGRWYFGDNGTLSQARDTSHSGVDSFNWDTHARPLTNFSGNTGSGTNGLWTATPNYDWEQPPAHSAVSYVTPPLSANTTVIGSGSVQPWVKSPVPNADFQATISEIRPDGKETFVQGGWVRGNARKLDPTKGNALEPVLSLRASDVSPLPSDTFVPVTIPLYYEGHVYRAGSRIRVTITAPNGDQPVWSFGETEPESGTPQIEIGHGLNMESRLTLPVVPGVNVPTGLPPCPGLRGEPCRDYQPIVNDTPTP